MVYLRLVGKRVVDFLLLLIELFSPAVKVKDIRRNRGGRKERKAGHFERKFQRVGGGSFTNGSWHQKTRVPGLSRGVICVIICRFDTTDTDTQTDRHTMTANTNASIASRG